MSETKWNPYNRNCSSRQVLDRIGDRWTILVIGVLGKGRMRFSQLVAEVDGVSQKMLTQTLRALETDGLVTRTVYAEVPPKVEYELTELGQSLRMPLKALEEWTAAHMEQVLAAREKTLSPSSNTN